MLANNVERELEGVPTTVAVSPVQVVQAAKGHLNQDIFSLYDESALSLVLDKRYNMFLRSQARLAKLKRFA